MKKLIFVTILILLFFSLVLCSKINGMNDKGFSSDSSYDVTKESYIENNIKVNYPQIVNLSNQSKQKRLNDIIKQSAYGYLKSSSLNQKNEFKLNIDYRIGLKNNKVLSIQFYGDIDNKVHINKEFYTINIDLINEKILRLADILNINENFVFKFRNAKLISPTDYTKDMLLSGGYDNSNEDWVERFNNADSKGSGSQDYSYLTEDSLGISVPIAHASGDHAEFEIKYQDLKDNIKTENKIWKDLLH